MSRTKLAIQAIREAGNCLEYFFRKGFQVSHKGQVDLVTEADVEAERILTRHISRVFPEDEIVAEEEGHTSGNSGFTWYIDPLDGTTNFAHGLPHFAVSVGLWRGTIPEAGWVYDPIKRELFSAETGKGAWRNGFPIEVSKQADLKSALVVTGFPYDRRSRMSTLLARLEKILMTAQGLRRHGAASLDLAYVASGRLDVFYEDGLKSWDMAGGSLLVKEAHGICRHFCGEAWSLGKSDIVAGNPAMVSQLISALAQVDPLAFSRT